MTGALTVEAMEANGSPVNAAAVRVYGRTEDTSTLLCAVIPMKMV